MTHSKICYERALDIFESRLQMKHLLKGTKHRQMTMLQLNDILEAEVKEMQDEFNNNRSDHAIEEALDVMISALLIADKLLGDIKE